MRAIQTRNRMIRTEAGLIRMQNHAKFEATLNQPIANIDFTLEI